MVASETYADRSAKNYGSIIRYLYSMCLPRSPLGLIDSVSLISAL